MSDERGIYTLEQVDESRQTNQRKREVALERKKTIIEMYKVVNKTLGNCAEIDSILDAIESRLKSLDN